MNIKEVITENPVCAFQYYRKGDLYYCAGDFTFRVPVDDTGHGSFKDQMRTIELMRWVRKEIESRANDRDHP